MPNLASCKDSIGMGLFYKLLLKTIENFLRLIGSVDLDYFCTNFESRPLPPLASNTYKLQIFIPFRDRWDLTEPCLRALEKQNLDHLECHIHLIDNGSGTDTKKALYSWLSNSSVKKIKYYRHDCDEPFNFSKLCNTALSLPQTVGTDEYFLFLNNDVAVENDLSLAYATNFAAKTPECGAVGITLLYPNKEIQHLFAAPGVKIIAAHPFKGKSSSILKGWNEYSRQVPAVTGAFLLISSAIFRKVNGFDENLPTAGQDIDLCLKLQKHGYKNWVLPQIVAVHKESASRHKKTINFDEVDYIHNKWKKFLTQNPEYPDAISRWSEQPVWAHGEGPYPYHRLRSTLGLNSLHQKP